MRNRESDVLMFVAPIKTFKRIIQKKSTEDFKGIPYITALLSTSLWTFYGLLKPGGLLVVIVNGTSAILHIVYVTLFLIYAPKILKNQSLKLVEIIDIAFLGAVIEITLLAVHGNTQLTLVGLLAAGLNIVMYASLLSAVRTVIKMKSVEYMPFFLSFFQFLNGGVWAAYEVLVKDYYIGQWDFCDSKGVQTSLTDFAGPGCTLRKLPMPVGVTTNIIPRSGANRPRGIEGTLSVVSSFRGDLPRCLINEKLVPLISPYTDRPRVSYRGATRNDFDIPLFRIPSHNVVVGYVAPLSINGGLLGSVFIQTKKKPPEVEYHLGSRNDSIGFLEPNLPLDGDPQGRVPPRYWRGRHQLPGAEPCLNRGPRGRVPPRDWQCCRLPGAQLSFDRDPRGWVPPHS
uniref:Uncharacterized protein LOC104234284 n=1 Tax=Nicotiana sylvestris TaxID=4096 RepID=A0A1U7XGQ5_NICSY|nr:PREDICTED: uncharacterized protein LOC104234284 [Nicotiana sylvestris]